MPIFVKNCIQCGPSTFPVRFLASGLLLSFGDKIDDDDINSDDNTGVDGILNLLGENLLVVQEVTVCNRPLCSVSERGVRCCDVDLGAKMNPN